MSNSGFPAPPDGQWGTNQPDCVISSEALPEERTYTNDSYWCYQQKNNGGKVCSMSNAGFTAPPDGQWGSQKSLRSGSSDFNWLKSKLKDCVVVEESPEAVPEGGKLFEVRL